MAGNTVDIKGSRHDDNIAMAAGNSDGTEGKKVGVLVIYHGYGYIYIYGYIYMYINSTCVYVYNSLYIIII